MYVLSGFQNWNWRYSRIKSGRGKEIWTHVKFPSINLVAELKGEERVRDYALIRKETYEFSINDKPPKHTIIFETGMSERHAGEAFLHLYKNNRAGVNKAILEAIFDE